MVEELTADWKISVNAKNFKKQCETEAKKLFNGIVYEGVKVFNEEKVN